MNGVVDGQQRLTTLTMMLCALRNAFQSQALADLAEGVHQLIERRDINNQRQYVLQTESSYPYLQEFIQKFGEPKASPGIGPEERLLKDAFSYIQAQIQDVATSVNDDPSLSEAKKKLAIQQKLTDIRNKILKLKLIYTSLENEDDAYIIFETLNTRGKDLRVSDLVKNLLTRLIKPSNKGVDLTKDKWSAINQMFRQSLVQISTNSFLHHFWLSRYDYVTEKKLYTAIKQRIKQNNAEHYLDTLVSDSAVYRTLYDLASGNRTKKTFRQRTHCML